MWQIRTWRGRWDQISNACLSKRLDPCAVNTIGCSSQSSFEEKLQNSWCIFPKLLAGRSCGYCSHIGASRFWVCLPAVMCGHVLLMSEWVFSFGFFLRSMNIRWTGDWCTGGLSRLLPSDHWDWFQHHLSPWSGKSRITEDKWLYTCI